ncbi:9839_t:CDS:1, partial [Gigaspora rosea]
NESADVQHNAVDLTKSDTEHMRTTVETDTDGLYSDEEQPNNQDDEDIP